MQCHYTKPLELSLTRNKTKVLNYFVSTMDLRDPMASLLWRVGRIRTYVSRLRVEHSTIEPLPSSWKIWKQLIASRQYSRQDSNLDSPTWAHDRWCPNQLDDRNIWSGRRGIRTPLLEVHYDHFSTGQIYSLVPLSSRLILLSFFCGASWSRTTTSGFSVQRAYHLHQSSK